MLRASGGATAQPARFNAWATPRAAMRFAPGEQEALVAQALAEGRVTHCPPGHAWGADPPKMSPLIGWSRRGVYGDRSS